MTEQAAAFPAGAGNVTVTMVAQHDTKSVDMAQVRSGPHPSCLSRVKAAQASWSCLWNAVGCLPEGLEGDRAMLRLLRQHGAAVLLKAGLSACTCPLVVCSFAFGLASDEYRVQHKTAYLCRL